MRQRVGRQHPCRAASARELHQHQADGAASDDGYRHADTRVGQVHGVDGRLITSRGIRTTFHAAGKQRSVALVRDLGHVSAISRSSLEIGPYVVVARRSGSTWYLGAMTNEQGRVIDLALDFLGAGAWQATIYADGNTRTMPATPLSRSASSP